MRVKGWFLVVALVLATLGASAATRTGAGWGARFGFGDDPDQIIGGVQYDFGEVTRRVNIVADAEIGLGDHHSILSGAAIVQYRFKPVNGFRFYAGGGVEAGLLDHDHGRGRDGYDDTDFEIQVNAVGGFFIPRARGRDVFFELVLGTGDLHAAQVMVGFRF